MKYDLSRDYAEKNTSSEFAVFWSMVIHVHRNSEEKKNTVSKFIVFVSIEYDCLSS